MLHYLVLLAEQLPLARGLGGEPIQVGQMNFVLYGKGSSRREGVFLVDQAADTLHLSCKNWSEEREGSVSSPPWSGRRHSRKSPGRRVDIRAGVPFEVLNLVRL